MVLKRSPDLLSNVKNRSRSTTAYNEAYFFMGVEVILVKRPKTI